MTKRFLTAISIFCVLLVLLPQSANAATFDTPAKSAILMEASTGTILFEKNADVSLPPASITKLMTLLLAFDAVESGAAGWDDKVNVSVKAWEIEGTRMFLEVGSKVPFKEIVTGISVVSANDGCIAIAEHISGSEEAFVRLMNSKAAELGMTNSKFFNCSGLPADGHVMSAKDIAVLCRHLIETYPEVLDIESMTEFTYNNIKQYNRNPLLANYSGADGLKTGHTNEAGFCLAGTAKKGKMRLISIVLNTVDEAQRLDASSKLLDYGFNNFEFSTVIKKDTPVSVGKVDKGKELEVELQAVNDITVVIPSKRKADIKVVPVVPEETLAAPVSKDVVFGMAEIKLDDEVLATVELKTAKDIAKAGFFERLFRSIKEFFRNLFK